MEASSGVDLGEPLGSGLAGLPSGSMSTSRKPCGRSRRIQPGVRQALPLVEASKAHRLLETGTGRGKNFLPLA